MPGVAGHPRLALGPANGPTLAAPSGTRPPGHLVLSPMSSHVLSRRVGTILSLAVLTLLVPFVAPIGIARACGCGAYSPTEGGQASVPSETALVRTTGDGTEDIYVSLTLDSDVRSGALLFPVPDRHASVSAGPRHLFDDLRRIIGPPRSSARTPGDRLDGVGAPASVTVENRQAIGPLDVVTLSSGDPAALTAWLAHNGFSAKPTLTRAALPYTSAGWAFVAVRLRPEAAGTAPLDGRLDPLHLHFATTETVYPMRLSSMASAPEQVTVFTLAPTRLAMSSQVRGMAVTYAGGIDAGEYPELASVTKDGATYLTRLDGVLAPADITDDFHFQAAEGLRPPDGFTVPAGTSAGSGATGQIGIAVLGIVAVLGLMAAAVVIQQRRTAAPRRG